MSSHHLTDVGVSGHDGQTLLEGGEGTANGDYSVVNCEPFLTLPRVGHCYVISADNWLGKNMKCIHSARTSVFIDACDSPTDPQC